jgi:tetratricopeptide (TPR) repeat protein
LRVSEVAWWAGDTERALALGEAARRALDERVEPLRAAAAEMRIGRVLWGAGRGDDAIEHLAKARQLVPADPPSLERADALAAEGRALMLTARFSQARGLLEEARGIAGLLGHAAVEASAVLLLVTAVGLFAADLAVVERVAPARRAGD